MLSKFVASSLAVTTTMAVPRFSDDYTLSITMLPNADYLFKIKEGTLQPTKKKPYERDALSGYFIDMLDIMSQKKAANFSYEVYPATGYGNNCSPRIGDADTHAAYDKTYLQQWGCSTDDVTRNWAAAKVDNDDYGTDMYWGLYYINTDRLKTVNFLQPYIPPARGALSMYGYDTSGITDFDDLYAKQKAGKVGKICASENAAYMTYLLSVYPEMEFLQVKENDDSYYSALNAGRCSIAVGTYPGATSFVGTRYANKECRATPDGSPYGLIGDSLPYGLNQFGVGVNKDTVSDDDLAVLNYWMQYFMECAPGTTTNGIACSSFHSAWKSYEPYTANGDECGYGKEGTDSTTTEASSTTSTDTTTANSQGDGDNDDMAAAGSITAAVFSAVCFVLLLFIIVMLAKK